VWRQRRRKLARVAGIELVEVALGTVAAGRPPSSGRRA
jgi:hypothetical protein